jgi:hypothetical protein
VAADDLRLDNGQHILIGAYTQTLALMRQVGAMWRRCWTAARWNCATPTAAACACRPGPAWLGLWLAVCAAKAGPGATAGADARSRGWALAGFRCDPGLNVDSLCRGLTPRCASC